MLLRRPFRILGLLLLAATFLFASLWAAGCSVTANATDSGTEAVDDAAPPSDAGIIDGSRPRDASADAGNDAAKGTFNVAGATATSSTKLVVVFDAPPTADEATDVTHYDAPGLTFTSAQLAGSSVTLQTTVQTAKPYTLTVSGVTRASDKAELDAAEAKFTGIGTFNVASAKSDNAVTVSVTFDGPPNTAQATTLANYKILGLTLSGTPTLTGNTVKLRTSPQLAQSYTVNVATMTRANDSEILDVNTASFTGTAAQVPTVTNVVVVSTSPNNGATPYNTGTATVTITGTGFGTVDCVSALKGVLLDDLDGIDAPVGTRATACTVVSATEISATFPAGIRTNGATGWNVIVESPGGANATSVVRFVPMAGLLISEVYTGTTGNTDHEFVELYNPTANAIDTKAAGIGLKLHVRSSSGADTNKTLTAVTSGVIPSHGFLLIASSASAAGDAWYANRDYTFAAALVANGGVYISLSATDNAKVLDKVGWGTQVAGGYETAAVANIASNQSAERKPAGGGGHATDSDANSADFNAPSPTLTPKGIADGPQP